MADTQRLKTHPCTWTDCGKAYSRPFKLREHMRTHTDERPYVCAHNGCDKAYRRPSHLKVHKTSNGHCGQDENVFDEEIPAKYPCPYTSCSVILRHKYNLSRHVKLMHQQSNAFKCTEPNCESSFPKQFHLKRHLSAVHNQALPYACRYPGCPLRFSFDSRRLIHERHHETSQELTCGIQSCPLRFLNITRLKQHIRQDHGLAQ